jgi:hypothetical protein
MTRRILGAVVLVILILVIVKLFRAKTTKAASQDEFGVCLSEVPQSWGQFKGGSEQSGLAFEDGQGTLRFITNIPCNGTVPTVALEVRRLPRN